VMLINTGGAQTCGVRLDNTTQAGGCTVNIDAGVPVTFNQAIPGATSMVLVFNSQGTLTKRTTYTNGGGPVTQNF
jgi:hypothetical protein